MNDLQASIRQKLPSVLTAIIDGESLSAGSAARLPVIDPDSGTELLQLVESDASVVDRAVASARACFERGDWSRAPVMQRQQVLYDTAALIRDNAEELAALDSLLRGTSR